MKYSNLVHTLQELEQKWRGTGPPIPPPLYPSHSLIRHSLIPPSHNIQYFACSIEMAKPVDNDLPIVVTLGINYTQGTNKIPDQSPSFSKAARAGLPLVEDNVTSTFEQKCINSFNLNPTIWQRSCLASLGMRSPILPGKDFHLVMTNLSPWITKDSWASDIDAAPAADLLVSPPHYSRASSLPANPFDHLDDLCNTLGDNVTLWIGHGLKVVSSHFRLFTQRNRIGKWLLTANTASGCKPHITSGSTIRFKR